MSRLSRWLPLAAVLALLGAAMFAAVYANPVIENLPPVNGSTATAPGQGLESRFTPQPEPTVSLSPRTPGTGIPEWVTIVATVLCFAFVIAIIVALLWATLRTRLSERKTALRATGETEDSRLDLQRRVRAAVDEGLAALDDADMDPRRAVIACWARLEAAAAVAGTPREPGDTSTELVGRLLAGHAVSADVLAGFAASYRQARFATADVDQTMRTQARAALGQLRDELIAGLPATRPFEREDPRPSGLAAGAAGPGGER